MHRSILGKMNAETSCMELETEEMQGTQTFTYNRSSEYEGPQGT